MTSLVEQLTLSELKEFLNEKVLKYNNPKFIKSDPIQIPHSFTQKEDIEISAFLVATIAWGNRKSIIKSSLKMMELLEQAPHEFIMNYQRKDLDNLLPFVHRTFNGTDLIQFIENLHHVYTNHNGLEAVFTKFAQENSVQSSIHNFKKVFFENIVLRYMTIVTRSPFSVRTILPSCILWCHYVAVSTGFWVV